MSEIDTSPEAVAAQVTMFRVFDQHSHADLLEALAADRDRLAAKIAEAELRRDAAKAEVLEYMKALRDAREIKRGVEGDAILWNCSVADGCRQPLLVRIYEQRRAAERDLTAAQSTLAQAREASARLAAENARLREALDPWAKLEITAPEGTDWWQASISLHSSDLRRARAAVAKAEA